MPKTLINQKNRAFHLFLQEYLERQFIKNRTLSYEEGRIEALPKYNTLSIRERNLYKEKASKEENNIRVFYSLLESYDNKVLMHKKKEAEDKKLKIKKFIEISFSNSNDWKSSEFILASVNIFVKVKDHVYPVELSLLKVNVKEGIKKFMNIHIDPRMPTGLHNEAILIAEETHQISPRVKRKGEFIKLSTDDAKIAIKDFLGETHVVFSFNNEKLNNYNDIEAVDSTLSKLFCVKNIAVGSVEQLLMTLQERSDKALKESLNVHEFFLKSQWDSWNIGCVYHFYVDASKYCTLARVKRWAFQIFANILSPSEIQPNVHQPNSKSIPNEMQIMVVFNDEDLIDMKQTDEANAIEIIQKKITEVDKAMEEFSNQIDSSKVSPPLVAIVIPFKNEDDDCDRLKEIENSMINMKIENISESDSEREPLETIIDKILRNMNDAENLPVKDTSNLPKNANPFVNNF